MKVLLLLQVMNLVCLEHQVRNFSYSAIVILRVMHTVRWFAGLAKGNAKDQVRMIVKSANGILAENARRAKTGKAPLPYDEALAEIKRVLSVELHIHPDRDLFSGDGYGPGCSGRCYAGEGSGDNKGEVKHEKRMEVKPSMSKNKEGGYSQREGGYNQKGHEAFRQKEKQVECCPTLDVLSNHFLF